MRVITGSARGRNLETLKGADIIRPTSQKIKETMFSAVQFRLPGANALDLFAGSGQLGIEALSRGAKRCVFVDSSREACALVSRNLARTGLAGLSDVRRSDASAFLASCREKFDIVLVDPPYRYDTARTVLPALSRLAAPGCRVLCETETGADMPEAEGDLTLRKSYRHGTTTVWLYVRSDEEI